MGAMQIGHFLPRKVTVECSERVRGGTRFELAPDHQDDTTAGRPSCRHTCLRHHPCSTGVLQKSTGLGFEGGRRAREHGIFAPGDRRLFLMNHIHLSGVARARVQPPRRETGSTPLRRGTPSKCQ